MTEMAVFDHRDGSLIEKDFARRRLTPAAFLMFIEKVEILGQNPLKKWKKYLKIH
ncbi:MAG: hypothetical protein IKU06_05485 [Lachnospiraceae bacterium]|nr:hypothetical protein [Lachnospiraceae bacterium]